MAGQATWLARRLIQPRVCMGARLRGDSAACRLAEAGLQPRLDKFGGLSLHLAELRSPESLDGATFQGWLRDAIKQWRAEGRIAVWLHVPILQSRFVAAAAEQGFAYHHAEADSATLTLWLADGCSRLPCYATHQLGVAGAVFDADTGKVLVVQDRNKTTNVWKFPGGLSEPDEDIGKYLSAGEIMLMVVLPPKFTICRLYDIYFFTLISLRTRNGQELKRAFVRIEDVSMYTPKGQTAVREVFEETGVKSEFKSLLSIRQQHRHPGAFGKSDMYIICRLEPSSFNINFCQQECLRCEWMDLPELAKTKDTTPITSNVARLLLYGYREGFDKIDITMREFPAVYTGLFYKLYHRELPDHYRNMIDIQ